jgi:hypothetical protein
MTTASGSRRSVRRSQRTPSLDRLADGLATNLHVYELLASAGGTRQVHCEERRLSDVRQRRLAHGSQEDFGYLPNSFVC